MKNNTEKTKALLQKALLDSPDDFALSEVRFHIRAAIGKIENVEKRRNKREVAFEERKEQVAQQAYNPFAAIQAIDEMIAVEKAKLEEIARRRNKPKDGSDDEDLQLLG